MMSLLVLLAVVLSYSCGTNAQQNYPFRNTSLSIEDRVKVNPNCCADSSTVTDDSGRIWFSV